MGSGDGRQTAFTFECGQGNEYRIVASNQTTTAVGAVMTFRTAAS
jgi:hypothetical protein